MFDLDSRYQFIVDQQPIGRLLFRRFCECSQKYQRYNNFLDLIDKYEVRFFDSIFEEQIGSSNLKWTLLKLEMDEYRIDLAQEIYRRFLAPGAGEAIEIINDDMIEQCKERLHEGSKDVFASCTTVVRGYLAGEPYKEFENSMFFHRYLQWKWLERYFCSHALKHLIKYVQDLLVY